MPGLDAGAYQRIFSFIGSLDLDKYPDFLAQRSDDWVGNVNTCHFRSLALGSISWTNWDDEDHRHVGWEGMEGITTGDILGMLLNLDEGTLTVYKNNRRLGVMKDGLSGPYCWYAAVFQRGSVAIKRGEPPNWGDDEMRRNRTG